MLSPILRNLIDGELKWREKEIAIDDNDHFRCIYRAFLSIVYAHYEAFAKIVVAQSVADMSSSGCVKADFLAEIQESLFANAARKHLSALSNAELVAALRTKEPFLNQLPDPPVERFMSISNLNVSNLKHLIGCVGLDWRQFAPYAKYIGRLVHLRHQCAHGQQISLDATKTNKELADDLLDLQTKTIVVMHLLAVQIVDLFELRAFELKA